MWLRDWLKLVGLLKLTKFVQTGPFNNLPMQAPKDHFSRQAEGYAQFRPQYPDALFAFVYSLPAGKNTAWDAGTGNGQVAVRLAEMFEHVYATDISEKQLRHAVPRPNVTYQVCRAESTGFPDNTFDLVTVAQALHWFDAEAFYREVFRTARPGCVVAAWGYHLPWLGPDIDDVIAHFYREAVGPYWDPERRLVDEAYAGIPFPFAEVAAPPFGIVAHWEREHLLGYLRTWSAVQQYRRVHHADPVDLIQPIIESRWAPAETREARFPVFMRVGRVANRR